MDMDKPAMLRILSSAIHVATKAGAEVRRITKTGKLDIVDKGVQDYQTEADRTVQRMIVASLARRFPKCSIVGEEELKEDKLADTNLVVDSLDEEMLALSLPTEYRDTKEEEITIWVDPLDGTAEFIKGLLDHVTILIGISINGRSVAGVIHQPFYGHPGPVIEGRTIWGLVNLGCFGLQPKSLPDDKFIITTTASHGNANIDEAIVALKADEVLKVGGAGHKVLLVIEGRAHSYVFTSNGCKRWDTCAPEAVLEASGGLLTDSLGHRIDYNSSSDYYNRLGVIASCNGHIHEKVLRSIPSQVLARLAKTS